jgi:hypothetical protein
MSSKKPIVGQVAWISMIPQLIFMGLLVFIFCLLVRPFEIAVLCGVGTYLVISFSSRRALTHNHKKGISLYKDGKYTEAITEFEKSYEFFSRHSWIDKNRFITLLSSSRISYTEMALNNMAFCYAQSGEAMLSRHYYS